jgi:hypothetical protein
LRSAITGSVSAIRVVPGEVGMQTMKVLHQQMRAETELAFFARGLAI